MYAHLVLIAVVLHGLRGWHGVRRHGAPTNIAPDYIRLGSGIDSGDSDN